MEPPDPPAGIPMSCMAVDPAAGGKDKSTIAMRYDGWFAKIVEKPGVDRTKSTRFRTFAPGGLELGPFRKCCGRGRYGEL